ncbi:MAG: hypothetical protein QXH03_02685 [Candidatus Bathyarchaeia archaeon]
MERVGRPTKLFSDAQIMRLYKEYVESDKDLMNFLREKGLADHYLAIRKRFDMLEKRLARSDKESAVPLPPTRESLESLARDEVAMEVATQTAKEAADITRWKFILGDKLWRLYADYAAKHGWDVSKIAENPIDQVFAEALQKLDEYPKLLKENEELRSLVAYYEKEYSPLEHARNTIHLINEVTISLAMLKRMGFRLNRESSVVKMYNNLITRFASSIGGGAT